MAAVGNEQQKKSRQGKTARRLRALLRKVSLTAIRCLPVSSRRRAYLKHFDLQGTSNNLDGIEIAIAESIADLEAAFSLAHDAYVEKAYINSTPARLRVRLFELYPTTAIFIAKHRGEVVGTMSAVIDSEIGLPLEGSFAPETSFLRQKQRKIAEISGLAVRKEYRHKGLVLQMGRAVERYAIEAGCTDAVICIGPEAEFFYKDILFYKDFGSLRSYSTAKHDPVVALRKDLTKTFEDYEVAYRRNSASTDLWTFARKIEQLPVFQDITQKVQNPTLNGSALKYFTAKCPELMAEAIGSNIIAPLSRDESKATSPGEEQSICALESVLSGINEVKNLIQAVSNLSAPQLSSYSQ